MFKKIIQKKILILFAAILFLYMYFKSGNTYLPIEELALTTTYGIDNEEDENGNIRYLVTTLFNNYTNTGEALTQILTVSYKNIPETREIRQYEINKKLITGLERIILLSENYSKFGIHNFVDIFFKNKEANDNVYVTVCKQKPEEIYKVKIPGYANTADYIQGMINHLNEYSFAPKDYKLMDIYVRMDAEGRNLVLPYLEILDDKLQITGTAVFKDSKMVRKLDTETSKIMNLLRENNMRGMISIQDSPTGYLSYYGTTNKKVKCQRKNGEYIFTIDLSLKGEVISNTLYGRIMTDRDTKKLVEERLNKETQKLCNEFIKKMQGDIKVDCLELGRVAAAKYGRNTGVDWDEIVTKSKIIVNTKVTVIGNGRGEY